MKLYKSVLMLLAIVAITSADLAAFDMKDVIAAPVPFNPSRGAVSIMNLPAYDDFSLEIFDINGDRVAKRSYHTAGSVKWNGRNSRGNTVKPGLYLIKVTARETSTDDYGKKTIRVLVKY